MSNQLILPAMVRAYFVVSRLHLITETAAAAETDILNAVDTVYDGWRDHTDAVEGASTCCCLETRIALRFSQCFVHQPVHLCTHHAHV